MPAKQITELIAKVKNYPSFLNSQPFTFRYVQGVLSVRPIPFRKALGIDPLGINILLSLGALEYYLTSYLAKDGFDLNISRVKTNPLAKDFEVNYTFSKKLKISNDLEWPLPDKRETTRKKFGTKSNAFNLQHIDRLKEKFPGVIFHFNEGNLNPSLIKYLCHSEAIFLTEKTPRDQFFRWVRETPTDGLKPSEVISGMFGNRSLRKVIKKGSISLFRRLYLASCFFGQTKRLIKNSSGHFFIGVNDPKNINIIHAGFLSTYVWTLQNNQDLGVQPMMNGIFPLYAHLKKVNSYNSNNMNHFNDGIRQIRQVLGNDQAYPIWYHRYGPTNLNHNKKIRLSTEVLIKLLNQRLKR